MVTSGGPLTSLPRARVRARAREGINRYGTGQRLCGLRVFTKYTPGANSGTHRKRVDSD